jgi:hypothetical protein
MGDILAAAIWEKRNRMETMARFAERGRERRLRRSGVNFGLIATRPTRLVRLIVD